MVIVFVKVLFVWLLVCVVVGFVCFVWLWVLEVVVIGFVLLLYYCYCNGGVFGWMFDKLLFWYFVMVGIVFWFGFICMYLFLKFDCLMFECYVLFVDFGCYLVV